MKATVLLEFENEQDYKQTMWNLHELIPWLVDYEELEIWED